MTAVYFENHQWKVTDYGIEEVRDDGSDGYCFTGDRLLEMWGEGRNELYDWPIHMAIKPWVDLDAFIQAFCYALEIHANEYEGAVSLPRLFASIRRAQEEREKDKARPSQGGRAD